MISHFHLGSEGGINNFKKINIIIIPTCITKFSDLIGYQLSDFAINGTVL